MFSTSLLSHDILLHYKPGVNRAKDFGLEHLKPWAQINLSCSMCSGALRYFAKALKKLTQVYLVIWWGESYWFLKISPPPFCPAPPRASCRQMWECPVPPLWIYALFIFFFLVFLCCIGNFFQVFSSSQSHCLVLCYSWLMNLLLWAFKKLRNLPILL